MFPRNSNPISIPTSHVVCAVLLSMVMLLPARNVSAQNQNIIAQYQQTSQVLPRSHRSPSALIEHFHATLLDVMKNATALGINGRYKKLSPNVAEAYDLDRWIRLATGRYWRQANNKQKQKLKSAFNQMSAATYASQFNSYSGENFKTIGERAGPQNSILVETQILSKGKKKASLTYVVFKVNEQWRIVDILLDNKISQLAVRRSEYRNLLKRSGVDGLIAKLKEVTNKLLAD